MTDDRSKLAQAIRFLNREARDRDAEGHPSPERLAAYHFGELVPEEDRQVQAHLEVCPECTELLLDLGRFLRDESEEAADVTDEEVDAAFGELLARGGLPGTAEPSRAAKEGGDIVVFERREVDYRPLRRYQALAAALFLAVVGLVVWGWGERQGQQSLEREVHRLREPAPAQELSDLSLRGGGPAASGRIDSTKALALRFSLPRGGFPYAQYEVRGFGPDGQLLFSVGDLYETDGGVLVNVPPGVLPEGQVSFHLFGAEGDRRVLLSEISTEVVSPHEPSRRDSSRPWRESAPVDERE